ncbi:MAG: SDR family NAD(P)-dependent oxidoreductase [Micrococcales bacterium]|nr:SDR family NAD(P)-dependent oxidoreductase [Micrococcales bacterium]
MATVLVTGSTQGLGQGAAEELLDDGHRVIVHARNEDSRHGLDDLVTQGALAVVGDLGDLDQTRALAEQVRELGPCDAVIHNAGVYEGAALLPVNVVAPYLLTALLPRPERLVYLSSGMHRGGHARLDGLDWSGSRVSATYSDSKLLVTALTMGVARLWPDVMTNAVDPGWVPTRMGGRSAPDDLRLGRVTQIWLATSDDAQARTTGGYWHHQQRQEPHPDAADRGIQDRLLAALAAHTGVVLEGARA